MSTATTEKASAAPPSPLGSFLAKMTPKPTESVLEVKAEEKPKDEVKPERKAVLDEKPKAAEVKPDVVLKVEDKPKEEPVEKRLKDTQKWGNEEHKARLDAERKAVALEVQLKRIEEKLDGTYEEPSGPTSEQLTADADIKGRIRASHRAAVRSYGEPFVMETVWNADSPYQELQAKDPRIKARVMEADDPVMEAIAVVKEYQDGVKYGRTPEEIKQKIEAELRPKLQQEILEGLKTKPGPATNTLGNVRGGAERSEQKNDAPTRLDFRTVFPWGASRT